MNYYKTEMVVDSSHQLHIQLPPELPSGKVEVIILSKQTLSSIPEKSSHSLIDFMGQGKGCYATAEEIDQQIRAERDIDHYSS